MSRTVTVEGDATAVDTRNVLNTQGSVVAPSLIIPSGVGRITKVIAAAAHDGAADGSAVFFIRLGGAGVRNGEQVIVCSAGGQIAAQAGADQAGPIMQSFVLDNAQIDVTAGSTVTIAAEMAGSDLGTARAVVTLVFE